MKAGCSSCVSRASGSSRARNPGASPRSRWSSSSCATGSRRAATSGTWIASLAAGGQEHSMDDYRERTADALKMLDGPERTAEQERERRKIEVALGYRLLAANKWGDAGDGHISARDPERRDCFWMLRYGPSYHRARVSDLVLVGPDGELVEGEGIINVAAYYIHHPILSARPEAVSATHVHTSWGTPFAAEVRMFEPITQESCVFFEDHALFDDEEVQVQSVDAGKRI